ncbi:MAG: hypothetical protein E3J96_01410 [Sulfurovum sp.]|nr:MAG: hypothetical protein E3J96_01410 [Sulfurovum sp.]
MTLLPITQQQYFEGLQKYLYMLRNLKNIEEYNRLEKTYGKLFENRYCTNGNFIGSTIIGALHKIIQEEKQAILANEVYSIYNRPFNNEQTLIDRLTNRRKEKK